MPDKSQYAGKRLLVFQARPFSPQLKLDGSEAVLLDVLRHFSEIGASVTVYCGQRAGWPEEFEIFPRVVVKPVLRFGTDYPNIYETSPPDLVEVIRTLQRAAEEHDAFYIHDSNFRFTGAIGEIPTTSSAFDLVYGHTVAGVLSFTGDRLIAISDYLGKCLHELFGQFSPLPAGTLQVINTGFSDVEFSPRDTGSMRERVRLAPDAIALLCPHRLDPAKGAYEALDALELLRKKLSAELYDRVRLLMPAWVQDGQHQEQPPGCAEFLHRAAEIGVADRIHLHEWIPRADMAEYYSLGAATLCAGTFVEAFGNVHVESMLSGTPAVISRVGAQRSTTPDELTRKVDPGDADGLAEHLVEIIERGERTSDDLMDHLLRSFGKNRMLGDYERVLLGQEKSEAVRHRQVMSPAESATLRIPPWAAMLKSGYYHDYKGYSADRDLHRLLSETTTGTTIGEATAAGIATLSQVQGWLRDGLLLADPVIVV